MRSATRQQPLPFRPRGGKREGAGRKPTIPGKPRLRHEARPAADARFPVHVTMRVGGAVPRLRQFELGKVLRRAFVYGCKHGGFRICQFSIQSNHIHMICEAHTAKARACGIQRWAVRVARGINRACGRHGRVFDDRYHLEVLATPTQVRNALCYVLQNARRHRVRLDPPFHGADPFSSAWWFDGWQDARWKLGLDPPEVRPVAAAESWLCARRLAAREGGAIRDRRGPGRGARVSASKALRKRRNRSRRGSGGERTLARDLAHLAPLGSEIRTPKFPARREHRREISLAAAPPGRGARPAPSAFSPAGAQTP